VSDWMNSRVELAATFAGKSLSVEILVIRNGPDQVLSIQLSPSRFRDSPCWVWQLGGWSYEPGAWVHVDPTWPLLGVDPWVTSSSVTSLIAANSKGTAPAAKFCGNCGNARVEGSHFCGSCGAPFEKQVSAASPLATLREIISDPDSQGAALARLIDSQASDPAITYQARSVLKDFFIEDFSALSLTNLSDGTKTTSSAPLNLAIAQDIQEAVSAKRALTEEQLVASELLVTVAPWTFGYWGAVKAILKAGPQSGGVDIYAQAVARLESNRARRHSGNEHVENLYFMSGFIIVARIATLYYMARRARRDMSALASESPQLYAQVASKILVKSDQPIMGLVSYTQAYILYGRKSTLDEDGRRVRLPANMATRLDAHPEIWDTNLDLVAKVFESVRLSTESLTWAFQVMESCGRLAPLTVSNVQLALDAQYEPLQASACSMLPSLPDAFDTLSQSAWVAFFTQAKDADLFTVCDQLMKRIPVSGAVVSALALLVAGSQEIPLHRNFKLAVTYLASTPPNANGWRSDFSESADSSALLAVARACDFEPQSMWAPIVERMNDSVLETVLFSLVEDSVTDACIELVARTLFTKMAINTRLHQLIERCLSCDVPAISGLGWRLIDAHGGLGEHLPTILGLLEPSKSAGIGILEKVIEGAISRANSEQIGEIIRSVFMSLNTEINPDFVTRMLSKTSSGNAILWQSLGGEFSDEALAVALSSQDMTRALGDSVIPTQLPSAGTQQLIFLLEYLRNNSARVAGDAEFGVAAAKSMNLELQALGLEQLATSGHLPASWLQLAESGLPACLSFASSYIFSLTRDSDIREAVLACLDSDVAAARVLGKEFLAERQSQVDDSRFWLSLSESDDPSIQMLVAEASLVYDLHSSAALGDFDRRVLVMRRRGRPVKEAVKARIEIEQNVAVRAQIDSLRIDALLNMARGRNARDREWALSRLASLAVAGVFVDEIEVSSISAGGRS